MPLPPYSLRHGQAEQAHLAELRPQVLREDVVVVDLRRARRDLGFGKPAHGVAQRIDLFAQRESSHRYSWNKPVVSHSMTGPKPRRFAWISGRACGPGNAAPSRPSGSFSLPIALMRSSARRSAAL